MPYGYGSHVSRDCIGGPMQPACARSRMVHMSTHSSTTCCQHTRSKRWSSIASRFAPTPVASLRPPSLRSGAPQKQVMIITCFYPLFPLGQDFCRDNTMSYTTSTHVLGCLSLHTLCVLGSSWGLPHVSQGGQIPSDGTLPPNPTRAVSCASARVTARWSVSIPNPG